MVEKCLFELGLKFRKYWHLMSELAMCSVSGTLGRFKWVMSITCCVRLPAVFGSLGGHAKLQFRKFSCMKLCELKLWLWSDTA